MRWFIPAVVLALTVTEVATADRYFAAITAVDPAKGAVVYTITDGKDKGTEVKGHAAKACVFKEATARRGILAEGLPLAGGLKNALFKMAKAEKPLRAYIHTADEDNLGNGVRRGDVVKILVISQNKK
jgi:hypothetical protein